MIKPIQTREESYISFTDDELFELGINKNDLYKIELKDDGSLFLRKIEKPKIDLSELPKEILESLIYKFIDENLTICDIINNSGSFENFINDELG